MSQFIDVLTGSDKSSSLADACKAIRQGENSANHFTIDTSVFATLPGQPFAYWIERSVLQCFKAHEAFESHGRTVKQGLATADDFRFVRLWWESSDPEIWKPLAKGGSFSPFYADIHLVVNWEQDGYEIRNFVDPANGKLRSRPQNSEYFGRPGLTWPLRTSSNMSPRAMPKGCIFGHKGPAAFVENDSEEELLAILAVMNSKAFAELVSVQIAAADAAARSYEVGVIQRTPMPELSEEQIGQLRKLALEAWTLKRDCDSLNEISRIFVAPALAQDRCGEPASPITRLKEIENEIDEVVSGLLGLVCEPHLESGDDVPPIQGKNVGDLLSWLVGISFGRFGIPSIGRDQCRDSSSPFDAPFLESPGMKGVKNAHVGVLTSDRIHAESLVGNMEKICDELGLNMEMDAYSWIDAGFFEAHLAKYSESRRQAPIYWPISTESGSYTLWFYYHRLTDQSLYKAVNDFVDPKLTETGRQLADLRAIKDRSSAQEKELANLTELESELGQFKADLLEIAAFWKPNLNDGVQITAAPLWKFFRLTKWRSKLKKTWEELQAGKYDWAHLALSIWPDRVVKEKCTTDRSIAIAHDLEDQLWHEVEIRKTSKTGKVTIKKEWQPKDVADAELNAIVAKVKVR